MRYFTTFVSILALCLLFASCAPKPVDMAALKKTIDDYNAASIESMTTNSNFDKAMAYYADDAVQLAPNSPAIKGKAAIKASIDQMIQSGMKITAAKFTSTELDASGGVAYDIGEYDMTMMIPGMGEVKDHGKSITIWKQQADGSWKVKAETWNTDTPMPAPPKSDAKKK